MSAPVFAYTPALPLGRTERYRRTVDEAGGPRWVPVADLFAYLGPDRSLMRCFCGHPDCMESGAP